MTIVSTTLDNVEADMGLKDNTAHKDKDKEKDSNESELNEDLETVSTEVDLNDVNEFINVVNSDNPQDILAALTNNFIGFSKTSISAYLNILNIDNKNYTTTDLEKLYNYLKDLLKNINLGNIELINTEKSNKVLELFSKTS